MPTVSSVIVWNSYFLKNSANSVFNILVISRDPNDPNRTRMAILAHADPGGGVPQWVSSASIHFKRIRDHFII